MKKKSMLILFLISFMLILSTGYALFSDTLLITGTAGGVADFDVAFSSALVETEIGSTDASATISDDGNTLTIKALNLKYPGAYVEYSVVVINKGSIPVKLTDIDKKYVDDSGKEISEDPTVKISYENLDESKNVVLEKGETETFKVKVMWDKNSNQSSKDVKFDITLTYTQAIEEA